MDVLWDVSRGTSFVEAVHIESFDDFPGPGARVTTLLDETDGTTTMTVLAATKGDPRLGAGERDGARGGGEL